MIEYLDFLFIIINEEIYINTIKIIASTRPIGPLNSFVLFRHFGTLPLYSHVFDEFELKHGFNLVPLIGKKMVH